MSSVAEWGIEESMPIGGRECQVAGEGWFWDTQLTSEKLEPVKHCV